MSKTADARIPSPQNLIDAIVDATPDAIFAKDQKGRYLLINQAGASFVGRPVAEVLGKDDNYIFTSKDARSIMASDRKIRAEGTARTIEERVTSATGRTTYFHAIKGPIRNAKGVVIGTFGISRDITERKRGEAALLNMHKLESLGTLAGGIAHDFNNILTAIMGNLSLLRESATIGEENQESLKEIQEACATAKSLSHQLLTFSRGGAPIFKVVDLRPLIAPAATFAARGSSAQCVFVLPSKLLPVKIDKDQFSQVIQNLVINAAQAMDPGGTISVRADAVVLRKGERPPLPGGRYIKVSVEDAGSGIPPEILARIFDPYFTTKTEGRGLGLSICYSIMEKHGGLIEATSKPGAGSIFTLHFPAARAADIPRAHKLPTVAGGSGSVLIMDDDALVAAALKRMLKRLGYRAKVAINGKEALASYEKAMKARAPYNAVIMDLTIRGGMGGKTTLGRLKARYPKAKVIVSSGYAHDPIMSDFSAHGFSGVLTKPYQLEDVSGVLRRILG